MFNFPFILFWVTYNCVFYHWSIRCVVFEFCLIIIFYPNNRNCLTWTQRWERKCSSYPLEALMLQQVIVFLSTQFLDLYSCCWFSKGDVILYCKLLSCDHGSFGLHILLESVQWWMLGLMEIQNPPLNTNSHIKMRKQ